jgi:hypothetical protein
MFGFPAFAAQYVSIATCLDTEFKDQPPLRILIDSDNESRGLLLGEAPNPENPDLTLKVAETIAIKKVSDSRYDIELEPTSMIGIVSNSFKFSITLDGFNWVSQNRTYKCKLD